MIRHWYALTGRVIRLQNDVTADLINLPIVPVLAKDLDQVASRKIAWNFHATSTSSRTKCRRIGTEAFAGWSKK